VSSVWHNMWETSEVLCGGVDSEAQPYHGAEAKAVLLLREYAVLAELLSAGEWLTLVDVVYRCQRQYSAPAQPVKYALHRLEEKNLISRRRQPGNDAEEERLMPYEYAPGHPHYPAVTAEFLQANIRRGPKC